MIAQQGYSQIHLGSSAAYRIKIKGYLDSSWSEQLGGVTIEHTLDAEDVSETMLTGELVDQAALFGVLNNLYSLGFPLLSVESELRSDHLDKAIKAPNQMKRSSINERSYKSDKKEISRCGE